MKKTQILIFVMFLSKMTLLYFDIHRVIFICENRDERMRTTRFVPEFCFSMNDQRQVHLSFSI